MDTVTQARKEEKAKKKRQQTAIVRDMKPLEDTLPTLELLLKDNFKGQTKRYGAGLWIAKAKMSTVHKNNVVFVNFQ